MTSRQRILLTGATGQLGRALQRALAAHDVVALSHQALDIADLDGVRNAVATSLPDVVVNAAAYTKVDEAERDPRSAYRGNAVGPRNLAVATAERNIPLLHVSTDYVFDGRAGRPYHEYDRPNPLSRYGESKLAGEEAVRTLNPRHYVVRTAWLYDVAARNFPTTILGLAKDRPELRVVADQYGSPTYVPHLASALVALLEKRAFGTVHLAGQGVTTWYEFARALYCALGVPNRVVPITTEEYPLPAPRPRFSALTTIQEPRIVLPAWEAGVAAFAGVQPR